MNKESIIIMKIIDGKKRADKRNTELKLKIGTLKKE